MRGNLHKKVAFVGLLLFFSAIGKFESSKAVVSQNEDFRVTVPFSRGAIEYIRCGSDSQKSESFRALIYSNRSIDHWPQYPNVLLAQIGGSNTLPQSGVVGELGRLYGVNPIAANAAVGQCSLKSSSVRVAEVFRLPPPIEFSDCVPLVRVILAEHSGPFMSQAKLNATIQGINLVEQTPACVIPLINQHR